MGIAYLLFLPLPNSPLPKSRKMYPGGVTPLRRFKVYGNEKSIFLVGINKREETYDITELERCEDIKIRHHFSMNSKVKYRSFFRISKIKYICKCEGILGCIKFYNYPYLYVLRKKEKIGYLFNEHKIYMVKDIFIVPFKDDINTHYNEVNELVQLFYNSINLKNLYFSYTYNLANSAQDNYLNQKNFLKGNRMYHDKYRYNYIWNYYHCKNFLKNNIYVCLYLIHGYIVQSKFTCTGRCIDITFIARRSNKYAGTRYRKRGINIKGYAANEVESEIIFFEKNNVNAILAYVQLRGSIPIFWKQNVNYKLLTKPCIKYTNNDINYSGSINHFSSLYGKYGYPIVIVNLLSKNKKKDESKLSKQYKKCINTINKHIPKEIKVIYKHIDLKKTYKIGNKYVQYHLKLLYNFSRNNIGYFYVSNFNIISIQRGILRFNCIDCLDRTNAAQIFICIYMVNKFLKILKIAKKKDICLNDITHLSRLYEQLGDAISKQYAGSTAHKKYTPGLNDNFFVQSKELFTSIKRYYINYFNDLEKQTSINLFLGYIHDKVNYISKANELDTLVHASHFRTLRNRTFWWVLPLECFFRKIESLLGRNTCYVNYGRNYLYNQFKHGKKNFYMGNTNRLVTAGDVRRYTKIFKNFHKNVKFYRCFSRTNVFKHLYNVDIFHNNLFHMSNWVLSPKTIMSITSFRGCLNEGECFSIRKLFHYIVEMYKYYNVYTKNFDTYIEKNNIFRFKIWRLIACYNYVTYIKIYFDHFFRFYVYLCSSYNVQRVYLQHVTTLAETESKVGMYIEEPHRRTDLFAEQTTSGGQINLTTFEKDARRITQEFYRRKEVSFLLEPYLSYYAVRKGPYSYLLISIASPPCPSRGSKKGGRSRDGCQRRSYPRRSYPRRSYPRRSYPRRSYPRRSYPRRSYPRRSYPRRSYPRRRRISANCRGGEEYAGLLLRSRRINNLVKSKRRGLITAAWRVAKIHKWRERQKTEHFQIGEETQIDLPYAYCPVYFNANLLKLFLFARHLFWEMSPQLRQITPAVTTDVAVAGSGRSRYDVHFFLQKLLRMPCAHDFFADLYMCYVYRAHRYKELYLRFYESGKSAIYGNQGRTGQKSNERLFIEEYDSYENIFKKKKNVFLIEEKITKEIKQNYRFISERHLVVKNFFKKYNFEMKSFREKEEKIKSYFYKTIHKHSSQTYDYNALLDGFRGDLNSCMRKGKMYPHTRAHSQVATFNVLRDRIERRIDYYEYCDPLRRELFQVH
ncbi:inositol 5-phosphatase, putative [Plasmodium ovale wallikeri]|uniref:Inositol 5-phosphatase, putative n=1 Tax=Plasmodium ovale wallikeri TaxID=864142 RepID=A0A1A8YG97_PLAOA|nr:inositol 5-phosphatase, putative [Plasmodium ovale wallikeri]